jgi:hypothetical protein
VWEREMLGRIFSAVTENGVWRIHANQELINLYRIADVISETRKGRLGHVERMSEERAVKKIFKNIPEGKRSVGKARKRWLDDVENDLKIGVRGWRKIPEDRDAWKLILKEVRVLHGL